MHHVVAQTGLFNLSLAANTLTIPSCKGTEKNIKKTKRQLNYS